MSIYDDLFNDNNNDTPKRYTISNGVKMVVLRYFYMRSPLQGRKVRDVGPSRIKVVALDGSYLVTTLLSTVHRGEHLPLVSCF